MIRTESEIWKAPLSLFFFLEKKKFNCVQIPPPPLPFTVSLVSAWIQKALKMLAWMLHRPITQTAATTTKTPLFHQPQDCENHRKSRLALAFIALTYIQPREALVTGFLNKALSRAPSSGLESSNLPLTPHTAHAPVKPFLAWEGKRRKTKTWGFCTLQWVRVSISAASSFCGLNLACP